MSDSASRFYVFGNENGGVKETEDNGGNGACRKCPESFARGFLEGKITFLLSLACLRGHL